MGALVLATPLVVAVFAAGYLIARWVVVPLPLVALLLLHALLSDDEWYSRVPELWQLWAYLALTLSFAALFAGVAAAKLSRRRKSSSLRSPKLAPPP